MHEQVSFSVSGPNEVTFRVRDRLLLLTLHEAHVIAQGLREEIDNAIATKRDADEAAAAAAATPAAAEPEHAEGEAVVAEG